MQLVAGTDSFTSARWEKWIGALLWTFLSADDNIYLLAKTVTFIPLKECIVSTHILSYPARPAPAPNPPLMINWCILSKTVGFIPLKDL